MSHGRHAALPPRASSVAASRGQDERCRVGALRCRHGCGYALANAGHDTRALQAWLGHKNIQHTVRYTELAPDRFKNFWRD
jgi:site-specific recombinase XerD